MNDYTTGTLRKHIEPEPAHWGWKLLGAAIALTLLSWVGSWVLVGMAV